ncbi:MAG: lytic transglycosylase domain-containing protein [Candidatus Adiutrix sp.]|jgi:soluble lytic murein transglycosylase-like protein|nr:lytic transglycosylase domain-containing protein [Candidatus Adiutrix sp.]
MSKRPPSFLPEPLAWLAGLAGAVALALPLALAENRMSWVDFLEPAQGGLIFLPWAAPPPPGPTPARPAPAATEAEELALLRPEISLLNDLKARAKPQATWGAAAAEYEELIAATARRHRVSPHLIKAVIQAESNFNPTAVSHRGAVGLMQVTPATAQALGVKNLRDPQMNIEAGVMYLKMLLRLFNDDEQLAVAAYNCGPEAMQRFNNNIPPFPETRNYVDRVMRYYSQHLDG